ncbi:hypothetical protein ACHAPT_009649 [Fusarium lateritium]
MAPKHKRQSLADLFEGLDISTMEADTSPKPIHLGRSIQLMMASSLVGNGSVHAQSLRGVKASFTIAMDEAYDYNLLGDIDPSDLHSEFQNYVSDVSKAIATTSDQSALDEHIIELLSRMVFGSNLIESAGGNLDITLKLCRAVFKGEGIPEITQGDADYEAMKCDLIRKNLPSGIDAVLRSCREIFQHAKAARHIINEVCLKGKELSEKVILETHGILTHEVDTEDGMAWTQYSGVYRQWPVRTGFHSYMAHRMVPAAMRNMISSFEDDIKAAVEAGEIDPVALSAKYCHKFVNIHPFLDGNGRICRLILNSILLKYGGSLVSIGEQDEDREEYLQIASNASFAEGNQEDMDDVPEEYRPKHHKELASFTLRHARDSMREIRELLK